MHCSKRFPTIPFSRKPLNQLIPCFIYGIFHLPKNKVCFSTSFGAGWNTIPSTTVRRSYMWQSKLNNDKQPSFHDPEIPKSLHLESCDMQWNEGTASSWNLNLSTSQDQGPYCTSLSSARDCSILLSASRHVNYSSWHLCPAICMQIFLLVAHFASYMILSVG